MCADLDQGLQFRGDGPPCWMDRRRRRFRCSVRGGRSASRIPETEVAFDEAKFLERAKAAVERAGVAPSPRPGGLSEMRPANLRRGRHARRVRSRAARRRFGARRTRQVKLGYSNHRPCRITCSARRATSPRRPDVDQAYAVGKAAVEYALAGRSAVMPVIVRTSDSPYRWKIEPAPLRRSRTARRSAHISISRDGYHHRRTSLSRTAGSAAKTHRHGKDGSCPPLRALA